MPRNTLDTSEKTFGQLLKAEIHELIEAMGYPRPPNNVTVVQLKQEWQPIVEEKRAAGFTHPRFLGIFGGAISRRGSPAISQRNSPVISQQGSQRGSQQHGKCTLLISFLYCARMKGTNVRHMICKWCMPKLNIVPLSPIASLLYRFNIALCSELNRHYCYCGSNAAVQRIAY
jgi:hypothetical protein